MSDVTAELSQARGMITVPSHRTKLQEMFRAKTPQDEGDFYGLVKEAIKYLGSYRLTQEYRADILNAAGLQINGREWHSVGLTRFAAQNGIRMAPVSEYGYQQFLAVKAEHHEFLPFILEQAREGKTSYYEIMNGLAKKFGGQIGGRSTDDLVVVPRESMIARVLRFCKNDSPELAAQIEEAFKEGYGKHPADRPVARYLKVIREKTAEA